MVLIFDTKMGPKARPPKDLQMAKNLLHLGEDEKTHRIEFDNLQKPGIHGV